MRKHRRNVNTVSMKKLQFSLFYNTLALLVFSFLMSRGVQCRSLAGEPEVTSAPVTSEHVTNDDVSTSTVSSDDVTSESPSNVNITEAVKQTNKTVINPIVKLAHDITSLYNAISDLVTPWFAPSEESDTKTVTSNSGNETEPDFDDFEDPGTPENTKNTQSSVLRYVRDIMTSENHQQLISNVLNQTQRFVRDLSNNKNNTLEHVVTTLVRRVRDASEGRQNLFQGYFDFVINEYSYKFWAVYMLAATAVLLYSAIAAIYYAKFNTSAIDYETYDDIARSNTDVTTSETNPLGLVGSLVSVHTFQQIMDAISSKKYS